ncbi:Gcv operon activator [Hartmannibacter diazotrophicus]|uniref:Gcv operon activator n=2 Tax=Hartmannibacter diazotrophicus TaxID=1482074 RepID=A0A2C9DCQ7_9HYPH|nr:Gcv operon activator [Hartmannibacter diazotrophicus]
MGWLRLFEAVGRHRNLTRAAEELGLSQPAVSYQIRRLETELGVALVRRRHRSTDLTAEGQMLYDAVRPSVERIDEAARLIRLGERTAPVRLFTDFGFAAFWLMPRIAEFRRMQPDIEVHVIASQAIDPRHDEIADISVLFGTRENFGPAATQLMAEHVVPVCSPGYLALHGPFEAPADLAKATLLHLDSGPRQRWQSWESWLGHFGVKRQPTKGDLGLNTYNLVIQAVLAEQGVALGWSGLVDDLIASGTLVEAGPVVSRPDRGYWIVSGASRSRPVETLFAWLTDQAEPAASGTSKQQNP